MTDEVHLAAPGGRANANIAPVDIPDWPRITLVTAVRNGAQYLEEAICSVLEQGYPNLEYIIVDGVSTDGSVEVIRKYEKHLAWWVSQSDKNVYEALNTGFARSTGQIMGWLNASDKLHPRGLFVAGGVFAGFPEVDWITGRASAFSGSGMTIRVLDVPRWSRARYLAGANRHIQQESTFWRRSLWEKADAALNDSYRDVGDAELWVRFFRHARLHTVDALIGGWRDHPDSISHADMQSYNRNLNAVIDEELQRSPGLGIAKLLTAADRTMKRIPKVRVAWKKLVMDHIIWCMHHLPGSDLPPVIRYQRGQWEFTRMPWFGFQD
jgi:glycosyltransferase involved in cell wall biosynthesis